MNKKEYKEQYKKTKQTPTPIKSEEGYATKAMK